MNGLITVNYDGENPVVSGRDLHEFLEVGTEYMKWFERMSGYGFAENVDFAVIVKFDHDDTAFGGKRKYHDHALTLDMAKELAMIQRTEKGKQARQYFIAVEKAWRKTGNCNVKRPQLTAAQAIKMMDALRNSDTQTFPYIAALARPFIDEVRTPISDCGYGAITHDPSHGDVIINEIGAIGVVRGINKLRYPGGDVHTTVYFERLGQAAHPDVIPLSTGELYTLMKD